MFISFDFVSNLNVNLIRFECEYNSFVNLLGFHLITQTVKQKGATPLLTLSGTHYVVRRLGRRRKPVPSVEKPAEVPQGERLARLAE